VGEELRLTRGALRLRGDCRDAGHHDARLAPARPRPRLSPVPGGEGNRAVRQRSGLPTARRPRSAAGGWPANACRGAGAVAAGTGLPGLDMGEPALTASAAGSPYVPGRVCASVTEMGRPR